MPGVRNSPAGDLEIELAGGLPIPLTMARMPAAGLSKLFEAMRPFTARHHPAAAAPRGGAAAAAPGGTVAASGGGGGGAGGRVVVDPVDEGAWRIDPAAAAELQAQIDAKVEGLGGGGGGG